MKVVLSNFATMFTGKYTPYAYLDKNTGEKGFYWECDTCKERAVHGVNEGVVVERTLSCACRSNFSYDVEVERDMAVAAEKVLK